MNIIKNYSGWLVESTQLTAEATAATPITGSLISDITSSAAPFNKWSLSKAKPGFVIFPSWRLSNNKAGWYIPIEAYAFSKGKNSAGVESRVIAKNFEETLDIFLPKGHPSEANKSDQRISNDPNDTSTEVNTYDFGGNPAPTERTMAEIAQKYPQSIDGGKYDIKSSISSLGPNAVLKQTVQDPIDGYTAFAYMLDRQPTLTPDNFLAMLDAALPGAKALMAAHLKGNTSIARGYEKDPNVNALKEAVKKLPEYAAAAGPAAPATGTPAGGVKPAARG